MRRLVVAIGNELMGDDAAGPLLARLMQSKPVEGWEVMDCGPVPENFLHQIKRFRPDAVLAVDACDMGLDPGSIRLLAVEDILASAWVWTTHQLPLRFFMCAVAEAVPEVCLVGIQPKCVAFGAPVSAEVRNAVEVLYRQLQAGNLGLAWL